MAVIRKRGNTWQAIVRRGDVSSSATFATKPQAQGWAAQLEGQVAAVKQGRIPPGITFRKLLERYRDEVAVQHRGAKWETARIDMVLREDPIADIKLTDFGAPDAAAWRDRRLQKVQAASVLREWAILAAACKRAMREWHWLTSNPFTVIERPQPPQPRSRRLDENEIERILLALGCDPQVTPVTVTARVGFAFLFAIETAMRAGEIVSMDWGDIEGRVVQLPMTKNGTSRKVPLSIEAQRLLTLLPRLENDERVFQLDSQQLDALFRKAKARAIITDLHFHDTRREALTRLAEKVDVMTLAKISGHLDLRILQKTYYAPNMESVADRLG